MNNLIEMSKEEQHQLDIGCSALFDKIIDLEKTEDVKVGRPFKEDKKIPVGVKLPPWLNEWMKRQPESKAKLIETALVAYYQIPDHLNPDKQG